ncbi:uncharacterized protein PpBr36_10582 [Pyricularia pennisetigena]|uniref:uncharacterized protein n=1 Tax=Pyricularia pennisetigena TaxID=1578925 RepID=UPI0011545A66|nr:uncharacterized protein PpBr36_10582 [Pyricularia pennisetigena]TLS21132.1 hypothetical protein PpBr36_10582 [Pyricularia pennisetigena]
MDAVNAQQHAIHPKSLQTSGLNQQREGFIPKLIAAHDTVISQSKIDAGFSNRELVTIHKLYQIQLYINWQITQLGPRCLRPDEWLTYACDFFQPVFALIHMPSSHFNAQLGKISLEIARSQCFPNVWTKIIGQDFTIDKQAAYHLSETVSAVISEVAILFPNMKVYQRSHLLDPVPGGRERVAGYLSRNTNTQNLSGESDAAAINRLDKPANIENWLSNVFEFHEHNLAEKLDWYGGSSMASHDSTVADPEDDWANTGLGEDSINPLAIAFDPEHKNTTIRDSVLEQDGLEYFTSASAFCARLCLLECSEVLSMGDPDFADAFQGMLRGSALWWFINELADEERDALRTTSIEALGRAMMWRFPTLSERQARWCLEDRDGYLAALTIEGCSNCVDLLRIQIMQLCRYAQIAEVADRPETYVDIWERLEPRLQQFFDRPDPSTGDHDSFMALVDKGLVKALKGERYLLDEDNQVGKIGKPGRMSQKGSALGQEEPAGAEAKKDEVGSNQSYCMCTSCCEKLARQGFNDIGASVEQDVGFRMRTWTFLGRPLVG